MSSVQVILLLIGFAFIAVSLFLVDGNKKGANNKKQFDAASLITDDDMKNITEKVNEKIEDITANHILDADDKLSTLTNEKIIAVCDYTDQLFAKLENNHQEVIFLYNMLQDKEDEMKSTLNRMEVIRKENQAFMDKVIELRNLKMKAASNNKKIEIDENVKKEQIVNKKKTKLNENNDARTKDVNSLKIESEAKSTNISNDNDTNKLNSENNNDKILGLYKDKKSLLEISKILGIGQGEVKLVIDLYGKDNL